MPKYSICHTTARPGGWQACFRSYVDACVTTDSFEYILCLDKRWGFTDADVQDALDEGVDRVVWNTGRKCMVDGYKPAVEASTGDVIILNSDDMRAPQGWDESLTSVIGGLVHNVNGELLHVPDDFVIQVSSGTPADSRDLMVLQILSRARYERLGYALYPAYEGLYSDDEFSEHARLDGVVINAKHLVFKHSHPAFNEAPMDEVYAWQNRTEAAIRGRKIFEFRRSTGFKVDYVEDQVAVGLGCQPPSLTVCLPGESFSGTYLANWTNLLAYLMQRFNTRCVFGYHTNVFSCRNWFADRCLETGDDWVLWMDDDNILTPESFQALYDAAIKPGAPDVLAAWCLIYDPAKDEYTVSCGDIAGGTCSPTDPRAWTGDVVEVGYTGFPSVLMRGSVLSKGIFSQHGELPGEDVAFCARVAERGLRIGVHTGVRVPHLKLIDMNPELSSLHPIVRDQA